MCLFADSFDEAENFSSNAGHVTDAHNDSAHSQALDGDGVESGSIGDVIGGTWENPTGIGLWSRVTVARARPAMAFTLRDGTERVVTGVPTLIFVGPLTTLIERGGLNKVNPTAREMGQDIAGHYVAAPGVDSDGVTGTSISGNGDITVTHIEEGPATLTGPDAVVAIAFFRQMIEAGKAVSVSSLALA